MPGLSFLAPYRSLAILLLAVAIVGTGYTQHLRLLAAQAEAKAALEKAAAVELAVATTKAALEQYAAQVEEVARRQQAAAKIRVRTQQATAEIRATPDDEVLSMAKAQAKALSEQWDAGNE